MEDKSNFQDIMPFVVIHIDFMAYIYIFLSTIMFLYVLKIVIIKFLKDKRKVLTKEQIVILKIKKLKINPYDQKQFLYDFTILCNKLTKQTKDEKLLQDIEPYKYHSKNIAITKELKSKIQRYIDELHL